MLSNEKCVIINYVGNFGGFEYCYLKNTTQVLEQSLHQSNIARIEKFWDTNCIEKTKVCGKNLNAN